MRYLNIPIVGEIRGLIIYLFIIHVEGDVSKVFLHHSDNALVLKPDLIN